jgi:3D (Asp-Asp-Asp) domain-containing protein
MKITFSFIKNLTVALLVISLQILLVSGIIIKDKRTLEVLATAYNSVPGQTDDTPFEAAWGDSLTSDIKSIAVSRDLIDLGLKQYSKVKIKGLPGEYVVLDKMNSRWEKKIDIYMGTNVDEALEWGIRRVIISWEARQ